MAKKSHKHTRITDVKAAAANDDQPVEQTSAPTQAEAPQAPVVTAPVAEAPALSVRQESIRRSVTGKFNKVVLSQIGGKECPRFYPMTWKERDAFMAKPEGAPVRERYEAHMKSVGK
jgi:hypothetical protein